MWKLDLSQVPWDSKQPELPGVVWERIHYTSDEGKFPGRLKGHTTVAHPNK